MARLKLLKSGDLSEQCIQKTIIQWVRMQPTIKNLVLHFANEGKRSDRYGRLLKDLGLRPGVADLFIAMPSHGFCGAWIELKSENGIVSLVQKKFLQDMKEQCYYTEVCRSIDEGINTIKWYCGL